MTVNPMVQVGRYFVRESEVNSMICTDCIHKDVCGKEGAWDEALITCMDKTELPHNIACWIFHEVEDTLRWYECNQCGSEAVRKYNFCHGCGAKMLNSDDEKRKNK